MREEIAVERTHDGLYEETAHRTAVEMDASLHNDHEEHAEKKAVDGGDRVRAQNHFRPFLFGNVGVVVVGHSPLLVVVQNVQQ